MKKEKKNCRRKTNFINFHMNPLQIVWRLTAFINFMLKTNCICLLLSCDENRFYASRWSNFFFSEHNATCEEVNEVEKNKSFILLNSLKWRNFECRQRKSGEVHAKSVERSHVKPAHIKYTIPWNKACNVCWHNRSLNPICPSSSSLKESNEERGSRRNKSVLSI